MKNASPNYVTVNGERQKMYTFAESFTHHVDLLWAHGGGLSWNMAQRNKDFQQYVRGYDPRAKFPCHQVQHRLPQVVLELQQLERKQYILHDVKSCRNNFKIVVSTGKYQIRAWCKCICRNSLAWMLRKFSSISTSPLKLCTRHTSVRQMML